MLKKPPRETEYQDPFVPLAVLENALRYWWVMALFVLLGAAVGFFAYAARPAQYEAVASFSVAIDFIGTGPMTQYDEDLAINTAGNVYISKEVLERVSAEAGKAGIPHSLEELKQVLTLERKFSVWNLRARAGDPQTALRLGQIWLEQGERVLQEGFQNALAAAQLERYIQTQENCLVKQGAGEPVLTACSGAKFSDIQANLAEAGKKLYEAKSASRGLFSGLTLGPFNPAEVGSAPVTFGRGQFIFLGGAAGFLIGLVALEAGLPRLLERQLPPRKKR